MHQLLSSSLLLLSSLAPTFALACSGDATESPGPSVGGAGSNQGGASNRAGSANEAGSTNHGGKSPTAGRSNGGSSSGGSEPEAGAPTAGGADGGRETVGECLKAPVIHGATEALLFEGAGLEVGVVRRVDPDGACLCTPWLTQRFALVRGAEAACVSNADDLAYQNSHHNLTDEMTAKVGAQTWILRETGESNEDGRWTVEARTGNALDWGPVALMLVSCKNLQGGSCGTP